MRLTLLGTGNAGGMPWYGCNCEFCVRATAERSLRRTPSSALLETLHGRFLIDAGQLNLSDRFPPDSLDGVLLTHFHVDHVQGLFHLRWGKAVSITVQCPNDRHGCADLYKHPGMLTFQHRVPFESFQLEGLRVTTVPLNHSKPTLGYLFTCGAGHIAYLTDTDGLPSQTLALLGSIPIDTMVIDCSFPPGSSAAGHNDLHQVLELHQRIGPRRTVLTHIGHDLDVWLRQAVQPLPDGVSAGYDGMTIDLSE